MLFKQEDQGRKGEKSKPSTATNKKQHWMTDVTLSLVNMRRVIKAKGVRVMELNRVSAQIQASIRGDHNTYLWVICEEIETHADKYEYWNF